MFQLERLKVVKETLSQLLTEVKEGKIEDHCEMRNIGHEIFETITTINEQITLNELANVVSPSEVQDDSKRIG